VADEWPIDLGHYADLCTQGSTDKVYVELTTSEGPIEFGFGAVEGLADLRLSNIKLPFDLSSNVAAPIIQHSQGIASAHGLITTSAAPISEIKSGGVLRGFDLSRRNPNDWFDANGDAVKVGLDGLFVDTLRYGTGTQFPIPTVTQSLVREFLANLTYLRASRKRPCRGYERGASGRTALGYAGEWTAVVLHTEALNEVEYAIPHVPPTSREEAVTQLDKPWETHRGSLATAIAHWLTRLGLAQSVETKESQLYPGRLEIRVVHHSAQGTRDITEVGYGLSQVLPVLVGGLRQPVEGPFVVDLPEGHLHPRPQAELADFFCSIALSGRVAIVETHSEMFFHRLRLRAALNRDLSDRIAVYFFEPPEGGQCRSPRRVGLDFQEELKWPTGFLQEGWEMEGQISAARAARKGAG